MPHNSNRCQAISGCTWFTGRAAPEHADLVLQLAGQGPVCLQGAGQQTHPHILPTPLGLGGTVKGRARSARWSVHR